MSTQQPGNNRHDVFTGNHEVLQRQDEWGKYLPQYENFTEKLSLATLESSGSINLIEFSRLGMNQVIAKEFGTANLGCMDEGAQKSRFSSFTDIESLNIATPGVMVLMNEEDRIRYDSYISKILEAHQVKDITVMPHLHCAAAEGALETGEEHSPANITKKAVDAGNLVASELDFMNKGIEVNRELINHLSRPENLHNAFGIMVYPFDMNSEDESSKARISHIALGNNLHLPLFNVTAPLGNEQDMDIAVFGSVLAVKIANGDHGFGKEQFDENHPFIFNVAANGAKEVELAKEIISKSIAKMENTGSIQFNIIDISK